MMNVTVIRRIVYFTGGVAVGVLGTRKFFKTRYEDIAIEEIESMKDLYDRKCEALKLEFGIEETEATDDVVELSVVYDNDEPIDELEITQQMMEDYDEVIEEYKTDDIKAVKIYPIDDVTFIDTPSGYECISLEYYEIDDVLVEDDEIVSDPYALIGYRELAHLFEEYEEGADAAYVRNEVLKIDYEVVKVNTSFTEGVAHLNETYDE